MLAFPVKHVQSKSYDGFDLIITASSSCTLSLLHFHRESQKLSVLQSKDINFEACGMISCSIFNPADFNHLRGFSEVDKRQLVTQTKKNMEEKGLKSTCEYIHVLSCFRVQTYTKVVDIRIIMKTN